MNETKVAGFINESHTDEVRSVFGDELAEKLAAAPPGTTFLQLLFEVK